MIEIDEVNNVGTHEVLYLEKISTPKILENGFPIFGKKIISTALCNKKYLAFL